MREDVWWQPFPAAFSLSKLGFFCHNWGDSYFVHYVYRDWSVSNLAHSTYIIIYTYIYIYTYRHVILYNDTYIHILMYIYIYVCSNNHFDMYVKRQGEKSCSLLPSLDPIWTCQLPGVRSLLCLAQQYHRSLGERDTRFWEFGGHPMTGTDWWLKI